MTSGERQALRLKLSRRTTDRPSFKPMKINRLSFLAIALVGAILSAQDLQVEVKVVEAKKRVKTTKATELVFKDQTIDGPALVTYTDWKKAPLGLVKVTTDASNIRVKCRTATVKDLGNSIYGISKPGNHIVEVMVIDFDKKYWDEQDVEVQIGKPDDGDNNDDGEADDGEDEPEPAPDVRNTYKLGKTAYKNSRGLDRIERDRIAEVYRQSGQFLFGRPTWKTIEEVFLWQRTKIDTKFLESMITPINEAQRVWCNENQCGAFTRDDWFAAFEEIAEAVEK